MVWGGCLAFFGFFLGDWNDWKWSNAYLRCCFPLSSILLAVVTVIQCYRSDALFSPIPCAIAYAGALVFLLLLLYTLFGALPAKESYTEQTKGRTACTRGMYALCRHPGVLWFIGLYLCLNLAAGLSIYTAAIYCSLNMLLILFEDRFVFPAQLEGYREYQQTTPFLIPTKNSIVSCWNDFRC